MEEKQNIDWTLVGKYLNDEANPQERKKIEQWIAQSNLQKTELQESKQLLKATDWYYQSKKFDSSEAWKKVHAKTVGANSGYIRLKPARKQIVTRFMKYAAIIIFAVALGVLAYSVGFRNSLGNGFGEFVTADNEVLTDLVLPDGSLVTLNADSKLIFPKEFQNNIREVTITGEAFFNVEPDPEKPFIIHAGNAVVKVLGTAFNVNAYPENEAVEVIVESGRVEVAAESIDGEETRDEIILAPGEKAIVSKTTKSTEKSVNTDRNFLAWKTHNLVFNETPLGEVASYLEKVYHTKIQFSEEELKELPLTATFENKPVEFVLDVIQLTFSLELTTEDDLFVLSLRENEQVKL